jgi:hypothetical protein
MLCIMPQQLSQAFVHLFDSLEILGPRSVGLLLVLRRFAKITQHIPFTSAGDLPGVAVVHRVALADSTSELVDLYSGILCMIYPRRQPITISKSLPSEMQPKISHSAAFDNL